MPFKLTIELSDRDLRHFRRELQRTRQSVSIADDEEILSAAATSAAHALLRRPGLRHGAAGQAAADARHAVRCGLEHG
jgi:hypothetical protein